MQTHNRAKTNYKSKMSGAPQEGADLDPMLLNSIYKLDNTVYKKIIVGFMCSHFEKICIYE